MYCCNHREYFVLTKSCVFCDMKVAAHTGSQAGTQEEVVSKAKQSRSEKKARKALSKLGLRQTFCFNRINLQNISLDDSFSQAIILPQSVL